MTQRARRQYWIIGGLAALVVGLLIGAMFGVRAQRRAEAAARAEAALSSRTDLSYGSQLLEQGKVSEGIAYLARAARTDPTNYAAGPRLISALAYRAFALPVGESYAHTGEVSVLGLSEDGTRLATATDRQTIHFWDVTSGRQLGAAVTLASDISASGMDAKGTRLAIVSLDGTLRIWEVASGRLLAGPLPHGKAAINLAFSPDGQWLAAGTADSVAKIWNATTGELKAALPHTYYWVSSVEFSPDGQRLLTTQFGGAAETRGWRVWSVATGEPVTPIMTGGVNQVNFGRFSPDGKIALICDNGGGQLWDWAAGRKLGQKIPAIRLGTPVAFGPDGTWLVTVNRTERTARIWDVPAGTLRRKFDFAGDIKLSRDGRRLLGAWPDGSVHLADSATGESLIEPLRGGPFVNATFSPDEREIWTGGRDGVVRRWRADAAAIAPLQISSPRSLRGFWVNQPQALILGENGVWEFRDLVTGQTSAPLLQLPEQPRNLTASPDRKFAAVQTSNVQNELWDLRQPEAIKRHPLAKTASTRFAWSEDGSRVAQFQFGVNAIHVWEATTGKQIGKTFDAINGNPAWIELSDGGRYLAVGDTVGNVSVFDVAAGKQVGTVVHHGSQIIGMAFSRDARLLASGSVRGKAHLTEVATGRDVVPPLRLSASPNVFRFTPDGRTVVVPTQANNEATLWDIQTGAARTLQLSNEKAVAALDFDSDYRRVAISDSLDGRLRIWSTATGQLVAEPISPAGNRRNLNFSPDGRFVVTYGLTNSTVAIWPVPELVNQPVPGWVGRLATAVAGGSISATGAFVPAAGAPAQLAALRTELATLPDNAPFVRWGRWFLADPATRPISPETPLLPGEAARLLVEDPLTALVARVQRLHRLNNRVEAEIVTRQIVELGRTDQTPSTEAACSTLQTVIGDLIKEGMFNEAEPLARACLQMRERVIPVERSGAWVIANSRGSVGEALAGQKRYAEAEPIFLRAHEELTQMKGSGARIAEVARALAQLYTATNDPAKAAVWAARITDVADASGTTVEPTVP